MLPSKRLNSPKSNAESTKQKPTATEWNERSSAKTSSHGLLSCSHVRLKCLSNWLVTVPVYWPWHAPAKIKWGGHFGVLTGMWIVQPITYTGHPTSESHRSKLGLRSPNAITSWKVRAYVIYARVVDVSENERVSFLIQKQRVRKSRTKHFSCCNLFISYLLRFSPSTFL